MNGVARHMVHTYDVLVTTERKTFAYDGITRQRAADWMKARVDGWHVMITHHVAYYETTEHLCFGCLARPGRWEIDCDGPYNTSDCGGCDWSTALTIRERSEEASHRDRVLRSYLS